MLGLRGGTSSACMIGSRAVHTSTTAFSTRRHVACVAATVKAAQKPMPRVHSTCSLATGAAGRMETRDAAQARATAGRLVGVVPLGSIRLALGRGGIGALATERP